MLFFLKFTAEDDVFTSHQKHLSRVLCESAHRRFIIPLRTNKSHANFYEIDRRNAYNGFYINLNDRHEYQ